MNYIVSGAAGFIGFFTVKRLLDAGHRVLGIDSLNNYYDVSLKRARLAELGIGETVPKQSVPSALYPGFEFAHLGVENGEALAKVCGAFAGKGPGAFIHLAAQAGVRHSLECPAAYMDANMSGFFQVLEYCRAASVPHLVFASSSSVYGMNTDRPYSTHRGADHPVSFYAATKRANELMAHSYAHIYGLPVTGLRFFTVYGPWGRPDMAYYKFSLAIMEGRTIDVYNNGEMRRDFTYIDDISEGIVLALNRIPRGDSSFDPARPDPASSSAPYRIYNLGNNHAERLGDFVETLEKVLGKKARKRFLPAPPGDVLATEADIEDARRDLGWRPVTDMAGGLARFAQWFLPYHAGQH